MPRIAAALAVLRLAASGAAAEPPLPIIDMHLHARDAPDAERLLASRLCLPVTVYGVIDPDCAAPLLPPSTDEEMVERVVEILERRNIVGVMSGHPLERVRRFQQAAPDRIIPAYQLDLGEDVDFTPEVLRRHVEAGELAVLGEIENQYSGIAPDDERMEPYWAAAEELDIPVALHLGEGYVGAPHHGSPDYRVRLGSPLLLEEVLVRHPRLRLYVMHYGSPLVDEMIAVLYTYPDVYVDVGGNTWPYPRPFFYAQLEKLVNAGFGKRIVFGSDQMLWPDLIEISIAVIEEAPFLSDAQKRDILYGNAARFLRLSDEEIAAIRFFVDVLGFELVEDSPSQTTDGRPKRWVVMRPPGAQTGLLLARADGERQAAVVGQQHAGRVGFFLRVDDFEGQYERMVAAGVEFVRPPRREAYGRVAVFLDVAGNRWDLLGP